MLKCLLDTVYHIPWIQDSVVKLALRNTTVGAYGSNTPKSLLKSCIYNQAVTQAFVVGNSANR